MKTPGFVSGMMSDPDNAGACTLKSSGTCSVFVGIKVNVFQEGNEESEQIKKR